MMYLNTQLLAIVTWWWLLVLGDISGLTNWDLIVGGEDEDVEIT